MAYIGYFLYFGLFGFFCLLGFFALWLGRRQRQQTQAILDRGVAVTARVIQRHELVARRRYRGYSATYQFEAAGQTYSVTERITEAYFRELQEGSTVLARFLPENPAGTARLESTLASLGVADYTRRLGPLFIVLGVAGLVAFPLVLPPLPQPPPTTAIATPPTWLIDIRAKVEQKIPAWRKAASDALDVHHVPATDIDLADTYDRGGVDYGYCQNRGFYVLVVLWWNGASGYGYSYIDGGDLTGQNEACAPPGYRLTQTNAFGQGWYESTIDAPNGTPTPRP